MRRVVLANKLQGPRRPSSFSSEGHAWAGEAECLSLGVSSQSFMSEQALAASQYDGKHSSDEGGLHLRPQPWQRGPVKVH